MRLNAKSALVFCSVTGGVVLGFVPVKSAIAQCVQADVGVQYNISGSRAPARRSNDVRFEGRGRCVGNTSVTTGVQGNVGGTEPVTQRRRVRHKFKGDDVKGKSRGRKKYGKDHDDFVRVKVNPQIDVYNPADQWR